FVIDLKTDVIISGLQSGGNRNVQQYVVGFAYFFLFAGIDDFKRNFTKIGAGLSFRTNNQSEFSSGSGRGNNSVKTNIILPDNIYAFKRSLPAAALKGLQ